MTDVMLGSVGKLSASFEVDGKTFTVLHRADGQVTGLVVPSSALADSWLPADQYAKLVAAGHLRHDSDGYSLSHHGGSHA